MESLSTLLADDHSDNRTDATALTLGRRLSGTIDIVSDIDYFEVDLVAGQRYLFEMNGAGLTALHSGYLSLYDQQASPLQVVDTTFKIWLQLHFLISLLQRALFTLRRAQGLVILSVLIRSRPQSLRWLTIIQTTALTQRPSPSGVAAPARLISFLISIISRLIWSQASVISLR